KAKNLANNPRCVLTVATKDFDLVVEGTAVKVTNRAKMKRVGNFYKTRGWELLEKEGNLQLTAEFSAPSAGPPPWDVYELVPETIFAVGQTRPYGATRWRF